LTSFDGEIAVEDQLPGAVRSKSRRHIQRRHIQVEDQLQDLDKLVWKIQL
jgi:hypothetical protein